MLYLQHGVILSCGKEVGGHSVITFRPKSSHLSRQFLQQCEISSNIARQKCESLQHYEALGHST